ncbi:MAG: HlyC/CorC family transporter [Candidatus Omnitrophica bacterium]|nr:HlyC/CorC family transporter [Candidatus Omnitrophota bacterium]
MVQYLLECTAIVGCILLEGFFAGSEIGLISLDKVKMKFLADEEHIPVARLVLSVLKNPDHFLGTILVGTNICAVSAAALTTDLVIRIAGPRYAWVGTCMLTILVLLFGELIPKACFRQWANQIIFVTIYPLHIFCMLLRPVVLLLTRVSNFFMMFLDRNIPTRKNIFVTKEELKRLLLESGPKGVIGKYERFMITSIFEFSRKRAQDIMVPFKDVRSIEMHRPLSDLRGLLTTSGFSRIPVYADNPREIVGFIAALDILFEDDPRREVLEYMRPILFVSQDIFIDNLLPLLRSRHQQIAILLEKDRNTVGLITIEDLLEELVGEISE